MSSGEGVPIEDGDPLLAPGSPAPADGGRGEPATAVAADDDNDNGEEEAEEDSDGMPDTCAICWDDLDPKTARLTPCGHVFCASCLDRLLLAGDAVGPSGVLGFADGRCPMCRTYVQHSDLLPLDEAAAAAEDAARDRRARKMQRRQDGRRKGNKKSSADGKSGKRGRRGKKDEESLRGAENNRRPSAAARALSLFGMGRRDRDSNNAADAAASPMAMVDGDANDGEDVSLLAAAAVDEDEDEDAEEGSHSSGSSTSSSGSEGDESTTRTGRKSATAAIVDVIDAVVQGGKGAGVRVAAAAQWPSALPFISPDPQNAHAITAPVPKAWIAIEFGQALRIQPISFTLSATAHSAPPRRFLLQGSTRPNIVHDVDPASLGLDDSDWFPLGAYESSAGDWFPGLGGSEDSHSSENTNNTNVTNMTNVNPHSWDVQARPLRWCTAVRVVMDGPNFAGTQELSVCSFRVFGLVREHSGALSPGAHVQSQRLRASVLEARRQHRIMEVEGESRNQMVVRMLLRVLSCVCTIVVTFAVVMFLGGSR
jgi:zinc-RING finger domain